MKLSIVIPCFNEADSLPRLLERFNLCSDGHNIEIILVDNGSTDNTGSVIKELINKYPFANDTRVEVNRGYGFGILHGLNCADGEYVGWTHADLQTDPCDIAKAFGIIKSKGYPKDVFIKGMRKGRPLFDRFFTFGMGVFETAYLGANLSDINAQPNVFHRSFMCLWQDPPQDFSLDLYALYMARRHSLDIVRFPVLFPPRENGTSSWNTGLKSKWRFIKRTVAYSIELKERLTNEIHST